MGFNKFIGKTCGFLGYALQYACITHCAFEYLGDFVMVSIFRHNEMSKLI